MNVKIICKNKRAYHDFLVLEKIEAGLELKGTEVKSIRLDKVRIDEAFVRIDAEKEAWINNMFIGHYDFGNVNNHEEFRKRKLLLHKREIEKIQSEMKKQKLTVIPLSLYFKGGKVKLEIAMAKGKKLHDKRESQKTKDVERNLRRGKYDE